MVNISAEHPLRKHFSGLVEDAFCSQIGLCDPGLTDYLTDLLIDFTHIERLNAIRNAIGKRIEQIASMLSVQLGDSTDSLEEKDRLSYRHIGDYSLFWSGVYPEHLRRAAVDSCDLLIGYVSQGKRSYAKAFELADDSVRPPRALFRHLSDDFESCVYGLSLVRRNWENKGGANPRSGLIV